MRIQTNTNSSFPSQVVSEEEKSSLDYGIQVGRAIEGEWFQEGRAGNRYVQSYATFHRLRLYASCLLYTSPSPRDRQKSRMPSSA